MPRPLLNRAEKLALRTALRTRELELQRQIERGGLIGRGAGVAMVTLLIAAAKIGVPLWAVTDKDQKGG